MQMNEIGDFLKSLRKSKGLTQQELADMLNVSNKTVSKWENGLGIPEMSTLVLLSDMYEVSIDDILRGSKKMQKQDDKPIERFQYIIQKSKHQYLNHLILAFGVLILGILVFFVTQSVSGSRTVAIISTLVLILVSLLIQVFNLVRVHYQLVEVNHVEMIQVFFKKVVFSSLILLGSMMWLGIFIFLKDAYWFDPSKNAFFYSAVIPALAIASMNTFMIYGFILLLIRFPFSIQVSKATRLLLGAFLLVIITPFIVLVVFPVRDVAISLEWSGLNQSTYEITQQEQQYYTLRLLQLIEEAKSQGENPYEVFEVIHNPSWNPSLRLAYYEFTTPVYYELSIELDFLVEFLIPLGYSNFDISETTATAYWFDVNQDQLGYEIYGYLFAMIFQVWMIAAIVVVATKQIKRKQSLVKAQ